jgi:predicted ATPase
MIIARRACHKREGLARTPVVESRRMPRITAFSVAGLRTVADVEVPLSGLTVLIGDNGTGKSTLLEALRIARLIPSDRFIDDVNRVHTISTAMRADASEFIFNLLFEHGGERHAYGMALDRHPPMIAEVIDGHVFSQASPGARSELSQVKDDSTEPLGLARSLLLGIDAHLPFDVTAAWGRRQRGGISPIRDPRVAEPTHRLELLGENLVNVYHALKNERGPDVWKDTLELLQMGFGPGLRDVAITQVAGGYLGLFVEFEKQGKIPALHLADGLLTYMGFVAIHQLGDGRSLLAFDEPETHLHPALLARVMTLLEDMATRHPVILATHSDRILDYLSNPVESVLICELDDEQKTRLRRLDAEQYEKWRARYRGLGDIRAQGHLPSVLAEDE